MRKAQNLLFGAALFTLCCALVTIGRADTVYAVSFSTGELISYESADPAGTRSTLLTGGSLVSPGSLAFGPDGNLYIGENGDGSTFAPRISKYEITTLTLSTVYAFSGFEVFPGSLAFKGNDLLIGRNPFFSNTGPITLLSNATGGTPAVSDYTTGGSLASSPGLALATDGRLYVSDQTYNFTTGIASGPVKRFDAAGTYFGEVIADGASGLAGPTGLVIQGDTLFTASIMDGAILQTDLATDTTQTFADIGVPFEAAVLAGLTDDGLIVGSPSGNGNIYRFTSDGTLVDTYASGLGQIGGIATVPEPGTFWLVAAGCAIGALVLRRRAVRSSGRTARCGRDRF
ncbi:MAG: PEP-CTERM sorting domain-containing protein [Chthoniobacterales bacterium]|jgi:hypothetical protein